MKHFAIVFLAGVLCTTAAWSQAVKVTRAYSYPTTDTVLVGLNSIRAVTAGDLDGDGKTEIAATNYYPLSNGGRVHVFEVVGNDSLKLVWSSPQLTSGGGGSTPRYVVFGDMDNDGKKEIIFHSNSNGIFLYEWDGVVGSDNYGTSPSAVINTPTMSDVTGYEEQFEVSDVDNDGMNELLLSFRATAAAGRKFYIFHCEGDFATNDPGFSSFVAEYNKDRTALTAWGMAGGSNLGIVSAQLDGAGRREILFQCWNNKTVTVLTSTAADTYLEADTTNGKCYRAIGAPAADDVALFGGMAADIDNDGREEIYLPTYPSSGSTGGGIIHMISFNAGENIRKIDSMNVTALSARSITTVSLFGYGYGDIDKNGKKEIYSSSTLGANIVSMEFQGGDKRNPANWIPKLVYYGDTTIYDSYTIKDSLGRIDTTRAKNTAFPSKIWGRNSDIDKDGFEDIVMGFQALSDSISITKYTWNSGKSAYDTVKSKIINPKRWSLRVLEGTATSGVEAKDFTVIMPEDYTLEQNYPNPFNPSTTISFVLPVRDRISIKIYDELGREVRTLLNNEERPAGRGTAVWNGKTNSGAPAASGTYFYSLIFGNFSKTNKMMLVK